MLKDAFSAVRSDLNKGLDSGVRDVPVLLQDFGDGIAVAGYALTLTGVGSEIGVPLAGVGNTLSNIGSLLEIGVDALDGKFEDVATSGIKYVLIDAGQKVVNKKINRIPGASKMTKEILKQNVDVKIKGTERLYDYMQGKKSEIPKDDNKVKIKKD